MLEGPSYVRCESGWTGDRCTLRLFHEGPHSNQGPEDLAAGDHFAGMTAEAGLTERRQRVLNEITDDIKSGNAHLMTRNEVVEFVKWMIMSGEAEDGSDINEVVTQAMEDSVLSPISIDWIERTAKKWFMKKEYEA